MLKPNNRVLLAIALTATCAGVSHAQTSGKSSEPMSRIARAIELEEQAVALHSQPARAADAARLHLQSASLRSSRDPQAVECMAMAAHLFNYAKRPLQARKTMEQAAQRALAIGDVEKAAQSYVEAAFFAVKSNSKREVERLGKKALLLSTSPLLSADQRSSITKRIRSNPALASLTL